MFWLNFGWLRQLQDANSRKTWSSSNAAYKNIPLVVMESVPMDTASATKHRTLWTSLRMVLRSFVMRAQQDSLTSLE